MHNTLISKLESLQPVTYALDRALAFRASHETRAMLHELAQRIFPRVEDVGVNFMTAAMHVDDATYLEQALRPLLGVDLSSKPAIPTILMTSASKNASGGKFWRAFVTEAGLHLNWRRWNTGGQSMLVAVTDCVQNDPVQEMLNRATTKIQNGYALDHVKHTI